MNIREQIGFYLGMLITIPPNFKFWILGQVSIGTGALEAGLKLTLFTLTALISGIIGKAGQDIYTTKIKPYIVKRKNKRK